MGRILRAAVCLSIVALLVIVTRGRSDSRADPIAAAADGSVLTFPPTPSASVAGQTLQEPQMIRRQQPCRLPNAVRRLSAATSGGIAMLSTRTHTEDRKHLQSFVQFPPRQKPSSFSIDQAGQSVEQGLRRDALGTPGVGN
jgi:hypothetical protein